MHIRVKESAVRLSFLSVVTRAHGPMGRRLRWSYGAHAPVEPALDPVLLGSLFRVTVVPGSPSHRPGPIGTVLLGSFLIVVPGSPSHRPLSFLMGGT